MLLEKIFPIRPTNKAIFTQSLKIEEHKWESAAKSIMTTDTFPKSSIGKKIIIDNKEVSVVGIAKGSGMIAPNMATMLAFIFTDALIDKTVLQTLLNIELRNSFNAITVDSDTSTNDTVLAYLRLEKLWTIKIQELFLEQVIQD